MTAFVKVDSGSWHIEERGNQMHTLCGLTVRAHPEEGEHQASGWATELPLGDKSCETCLRLFLDRQFVDAPE